MPRGLLPSEPQFGRWSVVSHGDVGRLAIQGKAVCQALACSSIEQWAACCKRMRVQRTPIHGARVNRICPTSPDASTLCSDYHKLVYLDMAY